MSPLAQRILQIAVTHFGCSGQLFVLGVISKDCSRAGGHQQRLQSLHPNRCCQESAL